MSVAVPGALVSLSFVENVLIDGRMTLAQWWRSTELLARMTFIVIPFAGFVSLVLLLVSALPTVFLVRRTRFEHAAFFVLVAALFGLALFPTFAGVLFLAGEIVRNVSLIEGAVWSAFLGLLGGAVGAFFWRIYAGAWTWRIDDQRSVAEVF